jgi:hypothetical protein
MDVTTQSVNGKEAQECDILAKVGFGTSLDFCGDSFFKTASCPSQMCFAKTASRQL